MASPSVRTNLVRFPRERSTSLNFVDHVDGVTTIGFMDQKTGLPKCDYDYEDPEMELYLPLISAERPGSAFRQLMKDRKVPQYIAKRAAEGAPEPAAKVAAPRAAKTVSGIVEMPGVETTITVKSGMPAAPAAAPAASEPEKTEIEKQTSSLAQKVAACVITTHAQFEAAVELTRGVKALMEEAEKHHRPVIDAAHRAHLAATDALKRILKPLKSAEDALKEKIGAWVDSEKRRREEEESKAREEAARLQREAEERQRLEYEAQLAEARARDEEIRRAREAELEATLEAAEANGASPIEIEAIVAQAQEEIPEAVFVPPPPPMPVIVPRVPVAPAPKVQGVAVPMTVVGVIENKAKLLAFIASNVNQYEALVEIKQGAVDRLGKATDGKMTLPGVRWEKRASVSIRK